VHRGLGAGEGRTGKAMRRYREYTPRACLWTCGGVLPSRPRRRANSHIDHTHMVVEVLSGDATPARGTDAGERRSVSHERSLDAHGRWGGPHTEHSR
jgi:hypothetical protein